MKRLFPTTLQVYDPGHVPNTEEEGKKGYLDLRTDASVRIGATQKPPRLHMTSPGNWYQSYTFKLTKVTDTQSLTANDQGTESKPKEQELGDLVKRADEELDVWRIIAHLLKTSCGRKCVYREGDKYLTVPNVSKAQADVMYNVLLHILKTTGYVYRVKSSYMWSPFRAATKPDVRVYEKKKQKQVRDQAPQTKSNNNNNNNISSKQWHLLTKAGPGK